MPLIRSKALQRTVGGSFLERWGIHAFSGVQLFVLGFHKDPAKIRMLRDVRRERRSLVNSAEQFLIHSVASGVRHLDGDMAEVGVYAGSTAKMICEAKGDKRFHICDTFEGLPAPTPEDGGVEKQGSFACDLPSIQRYLSGYGNLEYHVGFCPDSVRGVLDDTRFCFVHLDVDLYSSTKQCLEYFFPRMVPGGVLISHDYSVLDGVRQAFAEFTADRIEKVIETPMTQCMLVRASDPAPEGESALVATGTTTGSVESEGV
ncbi:MAG: TylF/MycF/NovP-related O-methyltransferase [Planctomycetaceae bacterium]